MKKFPSIEKELFLNGGIIGKELNFKDTEQYIISGSLEQDTITFVGGTGRITLTGTSITLPSGLQPGDLVIVASAADGTQSAVPTGYTLGQTGRPESTGYTWSYKFMGNPVDITATGLTSNTTTTHLAIAFRGVDLTQPLDVNTPSIAFNSSTGSPNPPPITTVTNGAMVVALGFLDDDRIAQSADAPSTYTFAAASQSSSAGATVMAAYKELTIAGTDDPAIFITSSDDWVAATLALKPRIIDNRVFGNLKNSGIWDISIYKAEVLILQGYFGPEYGNWNGERIIFSTSFNTSGTTSFDGIDGSYDANTNRIYDAYMGNSGPSYRTGGYLSWGTLTTIANRPRTTGRSSTIGYYNNIAYLFMGDSTNLVDIYLLSNLSYLGTWTISGFTSQVSGLAYDGNGGIYIIGLHQRRILYRIDDIEPTTRTITPTVILTSLPADLEFGLLYNGTTFLYRNRTSGDGKIYECNLLDGSLVQTYTPSSLTGYGISIDYANKKLYTGGLNDTTMRVFDGT